MFEWSDIAPWIPVATSAVAGWLAGSFYAKHRWACACLGALLFVVRKLDKRGVYLSPYDRAVINVCIQHVLNIK